MKKQLRDCSEILQNLAQNLRKRERKRRRKNRYNHNIFINTVKYKTSTILPLRNP